MRVRELEHEPAAEAVADPEPRVLGDRLEQVLEELLQRPRRLVAGQPVPAQVRRDDVPAPRQTLARESLVAAAEGRDPVQADERRRGGIAPLVQVEPQLPASSPFSDGR
jgi:hypothetical protein